MLERRASKNLENFEQKHRFRFSTNYPFEVHERSSILVRILAYFTWRRRAARRCPVKYAKMGVVGGGGGGEDGG